MSPRLAYAVFMLAALAIFLLARRVLPAGELAKLSRLERLALTLAAFVGGTFGARLPFLFHVTPEGVSFTAWLADGKTITTGLVGAYLGVELAKLALGIRAKTGDAYAVPLALALAVGRWGCFFNGCCFGTPTDLPWGVDFGDGVRRHPTQIYESLFHAILAGVLIVIAKHGWLPRQRLKFYLIAYFAYRFASEFIRPEPTGWFGLTFYQWVAVVAIVGLAVQWWIDRPNARSVVYAEGVIPHSPGSRGFASCRVQTHGLHSLKRHG
ncbi:MAG: prolipoprotein diacylglyceryl transferase [Gemmataceae bacterium]